MAKRKNRKKVGGLASVIAVVAAGLAAAHFLNIFTINDWKQLVGYKTHVHTEGTAEVHFIDVGQGDCSLVISGDSTLLIDTGEKEYAGEVCEYLEKQNVDCIDYMMLSHPHSDHMGGASVIIDSIEVKNIIIPRLPDDMTPTAKFYEDFLLSVHEKGLELTPARPGSTYEIGECSLEIISPVDEYSDLNNFSAAAVLTHGENSFLFTGDIEKKAEKDILESGKIPDIDVYKAAHHGSNTSNSTEMLEAARPDYAVIMCGEGNSYNHPHEEAVERLREYTDKIYRTDLDGTIVFTSSEDGLEVETEKGE